MNPRKKTFTKKDEIRIAKKIAQMKEQANDLQADLEQFAAIYEEPNTTSKKHKKLMEEVYKTCDEVVICWGRYSRNVEY